MPGLGTFASLAERDFRWYFIGNLGFFMAMQMQFLLRGYLGYDLTGSAFALGLVGIAITLPMLLTAPLGGVIADRVNKKTLLILTQLLAAAASVLLALLILADLVRFWHLLAVSLLTGVVFSFNMPARSAIVPLLVPQHKLMNAISLQAGGMNLTRIVAPAGGFLIAPLGVGWVYMLTAVMFCIAVLCEFRLPKHGLTARGNQTNVLREFVDGLRYVRREKLVLLLISVNILVPLFNFPVQQMLPIFAEDIFQKGANGLALLAGMTGLGGLLGAAVSANMGSQPRKGLLMLAGGLTTGLFMLLFALTPFFLLALVCIAVAGIGQMLFQTTNNTMIQATVPPELRGRVNSLMLMSFGISPLGVLPITAIADSVGAPATVAGSSAGLMLILLLLFALVKPLRALRMDALERTELSPAQAAALVAEGKLSQEEADRLSGGRGRRTGTGAMPL